METANRVVVQAGTSLTVAKLERNDNEDEKAKNLILAGFLKVTLAGLGMK